MSKMTKKGARSVTAALDNLASLIQAEHATLGIPEKIAMDFAFKCDLLSDRVEKKAGLSREALTELDVNKEKGFDPEEIGEEVSGPLEGDSDEAFMKGHFTQQVNRELREDVQDGDLGMSPNLEPQSPQAGKQASMSLAASCGKLLQASANVPNVIVATNIAKLASAAVQIHVAHQAGAVSTARAERTLTAVNHVLTILSNPKLASKWASVVDIANRIVAKKSEDEDKDDAKKEAGEIPPQFLKNIKEKKDDGDDKKDDDKEAKKKAGEIPPQFLKNIKEKKDDAKDDDGDKKDDDKDAGKKASHGFNLFA